MIISCEQCKKKFEIDSNLIPKNGRLLKCGSCNHEWFFTEQKNEIIGNEPIKDENNETNIDSTVTQNIIKKEKLKITPNVIESNSTDNQSKKTKKQKNISFLNIIIIFIISIISLILIVDTFKKPISFLIPNIEYILYNLYETLKDIKLFFNDLYN
jgi:predicted Zn finger-like uncharacterized protein